MSTRAFTIAIGVIVAVVLFSNLGHLFSSYPSSEYNDDELSRKLAEQTIEIEYLRSKLKSLQTSAAPVRIVEQDKTLFDRVQAMEQETQRLKQQHAEEIRILRESSSSSSSSSSVAMSEYAKGKENNFRQKLVEYKELHRKIMAGEMPKRLAQCVLINGWGNVLQEAMSCFLFALATNRAVIFNTGALDGYMPFKQAFRPEDLPFDGYNVGAMSGLFDHVIPRYNLTCLNFAEINEFELVTIHLTYDFYAPSLLVNPYIGETLMELLPENWYEIAFNFIFKLSPEYMSAVEEWKRNYFGDYNVGIQIRYPTFDKSGNKDHKGMPVPPLDLYAQTAEVLSRAQKKGDYSRVTWFMATQNLELVHNLRASYGSRITFYNATISTTFEADMEGQKTAFITWWILSDCDDIITTEASSYGTTAAARAGKFPVVCNHHKFCFRRLSPTPCQDTPFLQTEQPDPCLLQQRKYPHQFLTAPDNSCGYYKLLIYNSQEFQKDSWSNKA